MLQFHSVLFLRLFLSLRISTFGKLLFWSVCYTYPLLKRLAAYPGHGLCEARPVQVRNLAVLDVVELGMELGVG